MAKQTKITIVLDQPLNEYDEDIGRELLGSAHCFGVYSSFDQARVKFEEIDSDKPIDWRDTLVEQIKQRDTKIDLDN